VLEWQQDASATQYGDDQDMNGSGSVLRTATKYPEGGCSIIPVKADGSKSPALWAWSQYQAKPPSEAEVERWFRNGQKGIAILGGAVSGGVEIIDIDLPELVEDFIDTVGDEASEILSKLTLVETPRADDQGRHGLHVYYRCSKPDGNMHLAESAPHQETDDQGNPLFSEKSGAPRMKVDTWVETRGQGGYVVAPGSPLACHATGKPYRYLKGPPLEALETLTDDEREKLHSIARSFNKNTQAPISSASRETIVTRPTSSAPGDRPGDEFARKTSWDDIFAGTGWEKVKVDGEMTYWRRPGKEVGGHSATTGRTSASGNDLFCVFSGNAYPFPGGQDGDQCSMHSKFDTFALLHHGGDHAAAAKALAEEGFGRKSEPRHDRDRPPPDESEYLGRDMPEPEPEFEHQSEQTSPPDPERQDEERESEDLPAKKALQKTLERIKRALREKDLSAALTIGMTEFTEIESKMQEGMKVNVINASDVVIKRIEWLWNGWIPMHAITMIIGDPEGGKSTLMADIAARGSRGHPLPPADQDDILAEPFSTLLMTTEEDADRVIVPRFDVMGGDRKHLDIIDAVKGRMGNVPLELPAHVRLIEEHLDKKPDIRLVIIDPLNSFVGAGMNVNSDPDVRRMLVKLHGMAKSHNIAVVIIQHLNKDETKNARYRGLGSIGFMGYVRQAIAIGVDPDDKSIKVMANLKCSLRRPPASLTYSIVGKHHDSPEIIETLPAITWGGETDLNATKIFGGNGTKKSAAEKCADYLKTVIVDAGGEIRIQEAKNKCVEAGHSRNAFNDAKSDCALL
jgi:hypothetical protein